MECFLPKCLSCPCLPYLLALRSLHPLAKKECYACLYFPRNPSLIVLCVALLPLVFIVAINADWLTSPVLDSQYASYLRYENFSAMCPPVHEKSLQNVWSPSLPAFRTCDCTTLSTGPDHWPGHWWQTWRTRYRSHGYPDEQVHHSPTYHGTAYRAS